MSRILLASASLVALAGPVSAEAPLTDIITVNAPAVRLDLEQSLTPDAITPTNGPDTTGLVARLPGGASVGNGALSGQVQYRGLFGARINVRVDGQTIASGGPNLMDPPLHYAPLPLVSQIVLDRGVSPVRNGPGLGGGLDAVLKTSTYAPTPSVQYDLTLSGRTADDSYAVGGLVGLGAENTRAHALYAREAGSDIDVADGTIGGSEHDRQVFGLGGALRSGVHEVSLDLRRSETGPTGNPPFPMDIRYFDTDLARLGYSGEIGSLALRARIEHSDVSHAMNNFSLRPAPASMMQYRETYAFATATGGGLDISLDAWGGALTLGLDTHRAAHAVTITNPGNADFWLTSFPDIEMRRTGAFAEWTGALAAGWQAELGLRADRHEAEAGPASTGSAVPAMPGMLAMAFNAADREREDVTVDLVGRFWRELDARTTLRLTLARKTRAAGYVERFAWLPTPASGGLADGNTYVGDPTLEPETALIVEAGIDWQSGRTYARPTLFVREIDDYIQGTPFDATPGVIDTPVEKVSSMNGDPTPLRFANVDARLYGLDMDFGYALSPAWHVDGVLSWVRGERRDIADDLYRIAPARMTLGLTYEGNAWAATLESVAVAEQDRVSVTNSEAQTRGYVLLNARASWDISEGASLTAGVENLLDQDYEQHLGGYNRNAGSDIGLGDRLPGTGRSFGLRLHLRG